MGLSLILKAQLSLQARGFLSEPVTEAPGTTLSTTADAKQLIAPVYPLSS